MTHKLENPARVAELNPADTLRRIGLTDGDALCDIGAGTGIFSLAAAALTGGTIYAAEISAPMLELLRERALAFSNIVVTEGMKAVPSSGCQAALMCTVLHEVEDAQGMLKEVRRVLTPNGRFAVIEFHKRRTPMGPPPEHRLDSAQVLRMAQGQGFTLAEEFELGENFYCMVFTPIHI